MQQNPDLTQEQKNVLFNGGTEVPGTGAFLHNNTSGVYSCANCGTAIFNSNSKYDSTIPGLMGWPSFSEAISQDAVTLKDDSSLGAQRTEAVCSKCGGHLGHLFPDESSPNGKHFCINSVSLGFKEG